MRNLTVRKTAKFNDINAVFVVGVGGGGASERGVCVGGPLRRLHDQEGRRVQGGAGQHEEGLHREPHQGISRAKAQFDFKYKKKI